MRIFTMQIKIAAKDEIETNFPDVKEEIENWVGANLDHNGGEPRTYHIISIKERQILFPDPKGKKQLETWINTANDILTSPRIMKEMIIKGKKGKAVKKEKTMQ